MRDKRTFLKVKLKSLAAEARIIRLEERRAKRDPDLLAGLVGHRRGIVRREARHTQIAYAFIRGRKYSDIEHKPKTKPDWKRVKSMVEKYGPWGPEKWTGFEDWGC